MKPSVHTDLCVDFYHPEKGLCMILIVVIVAAHIYCRARLTGEESATEQARQQERMRATRARRTSDEITAVRALNRDHMRAARACSDRRGDCCCASTESRPNATHQSSSTQARPGMK